MISWRAPHLLILDEPTNHLDLETIDGLIVALSEFQGPVIVVSHDRHFIKSVVEEIWVVGDPHEGEVTKFNGEQEEYLKVAKAEDFKLHE
jgi:ATPase subunit of ABC transporter with duplicated ATPase domains